MRRGLTLIELLVAVVLFTIVASLTMMVFSNQDRSFRTESDKAEVALMARGSLDELARAVRMTGSGLPEEAAGVRVSGGRLTFVMNESGGADEMADFDYDPTALLLGVGVKEASGFSHMGYARVTLTIASAAVPSVRVLPIVKRFAHAGGCGDSLVLDASVLHPPSGPNAVAVEANTVVYNVDSLSYWKQGDSLMVQRNRLNPSVYARGLDDLTWSFWNTTAGWQTSLAGLGADKHIDKIRIRLVTRNQSVDAKLLAQDPTSRGYRFSVLETDIALRNTGLVNQ